MGRVSNLGDYKVPKLSGWEIAEMQRQASEIMAEWPPLRTHNSERWRRLTFLARRYGITVRTLYRYLEKAA